jgi:hypothetical protein
MSCSQKVTSYFTKETITHEDKHTLQPKKDCLHSTHNHSFRSMDCTPSVIRNLHAQNLSCGRTKCQAVVVNVLAPFAMQNFLGRTGNCEVAIYKLWWILKNIKV